MLSGEFEEPIKISIYYYNKYENIELYTVKPVKTSYK